jgi:hypothetical protein
LTRIDPMVRVGREADSKYPRIVSGVNPGSMLLASTIRTYPYVSLLAFVYYFPSFHLVFSLFVSHSFTLYVELEVCETGPFFSLLSFWANRKRCKYIFPANQRARGRLVSFVLPSPLRLASHSGYCSSTILYSSGAPAPCLRLLSLLKPLPKRRTHPQTSNRCSMPP